MKMWTTGTCEINGIISAILVGTIASQSVPYSLEKIRKMLN